MIRLKFRFSSFSSCRKRIFHILINYPLLKIFLSLTFPLNILYSVLEEYDYFAMACPQSRLITQIFPNEPTSQIEAGVYLRPGWSWN